MLTVRAAAQRGRANLDWLDSRHTFSFADYHDPRYLGFRALRVLNEDRVAPGRGFDLHPHRDMEILTYVVEGSLQHRDSLGTGSIIQPGDVQRMSAGTGVLHSEYNASTTAPVHFLQIWLLPTRRDLPPSYEQKTFSADEKKGRLRVVASPDGRDGSLLIHAAAAVHAGLLTSGDEIEHALPAGRHAWVQVASGGVRVNGEDLEAGDGASISDEAAVHLVGRRAGEILLFELE